MQEVAKVAVTALSPSIVTWQVADVPEQTPPDQPVKTAPLSAVAVKVTFVPVVKAALHVVPQVMPVGVLVTTPEPDFEMTKEANDPDCPERTGHT